MLATGSGDRSVAFSAYIAIMRRRVWLRLSFWHANVENCLINSIMWKSIERLARDWQRIVGRLCRACGTFWRRQYDDGSLYIARIHTQIVMAAHALADYGALVQHGNAYDDQ